MTGLDHPLVRAYLQRLDIVGRRLPDDRRAELRADIEEHLVEAAAATDGSDAAMSVVLERLGAPEDVVAEAATGVFVTGPPLDPAAARYPFAGPPERAPSGRPVLETTALVLLVLSIPVALSIVLTVVAPVLWLVGLVLLLISKRWTTADKAWGAVAYGIFGVPFLGLAVMGMAFPLYAGSCTSSAGADGVVVESCTGGPPGWLPVVSIGAGLAIVGLWVWTALRLHRRIRDPRADLAAQSVAPQPAR